MEKNSKVPWSIVSILQWISDEMATKINLLNLNLKKLEKNIEKPVKALIHISYFIFSYFIQLQSTR